MKIRTIEDLAQFTRDLISIIIGSYNFELKVSSGTNTTVFEITSKEPTLYSKLIGKSGRNITAIKSIVEQAAITAHLQRPMVEALRINPGAHSQNKGQ